MKSDGGLVTDAGGGKLLARGWLVPVDKAHPSVAAEFSQGCGTAVTVGHLHPPSKSHYLLFPSLSLSMGSFLRGMRVFSNCISTHPDNSPSGYSSAFPFLFHFTFGLELRSSQLSQGGLLLHLLPLTLKGMFWCFQESIFESCPALTSSFILRRSFPWNPSQLC